MVGRETFLIAVAGFPAMKFLGSVSVSAVSGPLAGRASGTLPGQMGIWVWPGEGCQTGCCAGCWERRAAQADRIQRVRSRGFIRIPGTRISAIEGRRSSYGARFCGRKKMRVRCLERHGAARPSSSHRLPDDFDGVEAEFFVVSEDGEGFGDGLGDEEAVEGVAVVRGQSFESQDVLVADGEELHAVVFHLVADIGHRRAEGV